MEGEGRGERYGKRGREREVERTRTRREGVRE